MSLVISTGHRGSIAVPSPKRRGSIMPSAIPPENIADEGLRLAVAKAGSFNALAQTLGMTASAIMEWQQVPSHRILQVEAVTGIPREKLRPDLYRSSYKDRIALDLKQIELVIRIEMLKALQQALPQIEKVLREIY